LTSNSFHAPRAAEFLFFLVLSVTLALMVASFPLGIYTVLFTNLSAPPITPALIIRNVGVFVGLYSFNIPVSISLGELFVTLVIVYSAMFLYTARQGTGTVLAMKASLTKGFDSLYGSPLVVTIMALGATVFLVALLDRLLTAVNLPTGQLTGNALETFVGVTIAPLREEFGFRVVIIGSVAFLMTVFSSRRRAVIAFWRPSLIYAGDRTDIVRKVVLYTVVAGSALLFGIAHILPGSTWQIGKLPQAAMAGVILGLLYIRYGFAAAVLLHWGVDYFGTVFSFFGQGYWGVPWNSDNGTALDRFVALDLVILLGLTSFLLLSYKFLKRGRGGTGAVESDNHRGINIEGPSQEV
jgi:hypothetical protein